MTNETPETKALTSEELLAIAASSMRSGAALQTLPVLQTLLSRDDSNGRAHYLLAVEQASIGLIGEAAQSFERAIEHCPELTEARLQYAMLLIALGETAKAKPVLEGQIPASTGAAGKLCQILSRLISGDLARVQAMLDSLVACNEPDRLIVQLVSEFVRTHIQRLLEAQDDPAPRYMGGYARLERPH
jgi:predicted Zn-dependent protease